MADASDHYMLGLLRGRREDRDGALSCYHTAVHLDPEVSLYWFRLAESRHLRGLEALDEVKRAVELAPGDPWTCNLYGLILQRTGKYEEARQYFTRALRHLQVGAPSAERTPGDEPPAKEPPSRVGVSTVPKGSIASIVDIVVNLSEVLCRLGDSAEALEIVGSFLGQSLPEGGLYNQIGNLRARSGDLDGALHAYQRALEIDPGRSEFAENCAAVCIELDMLSRAEELLGGLVERAPSPSVYNLMGNVARLKGEYLRAEMSYSEGLKLDSGNPRLNANLADLWVLRGDYPRAKDLVVRMMADHPNDEQGLSLLNRIRQSRETRLTCAGCRREWWVPRQLSRHPPVVVRGEPPGDAPAGKCPVCGRILCIECALPHLKGKRFYCPTCEEPLKLAGDELRYLMDSYLTNESD